MTIEFLLKRGQRFTNKLFLFKYQVNRIDCPRFAIIVSKKIHKSAVVRNRLRRQISESLRLNLPQKALNCVIIPHKHILNFDYDEIDKQIKFFLNQI